MKQNCAISCLFLSLSWWKAQKDVLFDGYHSFQSEFIASFLSHALPPQFLLFGSFWFLKTFLKPLLPSLLKWVAYKKVQLIQRFKMCLWDMCFQMAPPCPGGISVSSLSMVYFPQVRKDRQAGQQIPSRVCLESSQELTDTDCPLKQVLWRIRILLYKNILGSGFQPVLSWMLK